MGRDARDVSADVEIHDKGAQSFLKRQIEGPLLQATAFRNLLAILNDMDEMVFL